MNARAPLSVVGTENSWENVHPDVIYVPQRFAGYPYWMVFTPYPLMNDQFENPTLRASHDGINWERIAQVPEPLVPPPNEVDRHHADPEVVYYSETLYVIYLTIRKKTDEVTLNVMNCNNDIKWTGPKTVRKDVGMVSPTIQVNGNVWHLWFIRYNMLGNSSELVHTQGSDLGSLEVDRRCNLVIPNHTLWHIDILKVGAGYEALAAAFPKRTDPTRTRLFHLESRDGLSFHLTRTTPLIKPSLFGWDNRMIYRSTFLKSMDGHYRIWYSASSWGRHCGIGLLQGSLNSLSQPDFVPIGRVPSYISRLPEEVSGWLKYTLNHLLR